MHLTTLFRSALPLAVVALSPVWAQTPAPAQPLTFEEQTDLYWRKLFSVNTLAASTFPAAFQMLTPPDRIDRNWRQGAAAFGRNVGYYAGAEVTMQTSRYLMSAALHEDPRYKRVGSGNPGARFVHAMVYTAFTRTPSGSLRPFLPVLGSAAAGGFVTRAYAAPGFDDNVHAGQRSLVMLGNVGISNVVEEFAPELKRLRNKILRRR